jgi:hypothetical protein
MLLCHGILACFLHIFSYRNGNTHASIFLAVLDESFPMIPLNPDSVKWLVTFCFWTLKYRDVVVRMHWAPYGAWGSVGL